MPYSAVRAGDRRGQLDGHLQQASRGSPRRASHRPRAFPPPAAGPTFVAADEGAGPAAAGPGAGHAGPGACNRPRPTARPRGRRARARRAPGAAPRRGPDELGPPGHVHPGPAAARLRQALHLRDLRRTEAAAVRHGLCVLRLLRLAGRLRPAPGVRGRHAAGAGVRRPGQQQPGRVPGCRRGRRPRRLPGHPGAHLQRLRGERADGGFAPRQERPGIPAGLRPLHGRGRGGPRVRPGVPGAGSRDAAAGDGPAVHREHAVADGGPGLVLADGRHAGEADRAQPGPLPLGRVRGHRPRPRRAPAAEDGLVRLLPGLARPAAHRRRCAAAPADRADQRVRAGRRDPTVSRGTAAAAAPSSPRCPGRTPSSARAAAGRCTWATPRSRARPAARP